MSVREWAKIGPLARGARTRHFRGLPPGPGGAEGRAQDMPRPAVVILEETPDGFLLYRYSQEGAPAGDTWHASRRDAEAQAEFEFGNALGVWAFVPDSVGDAHAYVLARLG
jgi:hypothetical protein